MSKSRYINTHFWEDNYIMELDPIEKLLFLYLLTNPLTNISGIYELPMRRIAFDTGIDQEMILKIFNRFEENNKIIHKDGWVAIINFINHQNYRSDKIITGIRRELDNIPEKVIRYIYPILEVSNKLYIKLDLIRLDSIRLSSKKEKKKTDSNKNTHGELKNVKLTQEQYDRLIKEYGKGIAETYINKLSLYDKMESYTDHNRAVRNFMNRDNIKKLTDLKVTYKDDKYEPDEVIMK